MWCCFGGFRDYENLEIFIKLISVNGVGPKVAMTIMTVAKSEKSLSEVDRPIKKYVAKSAISRSRKPIVERNMNSGPAKNMACHSFTVMPSRVKKSLQSL